ncbi:MAG: T9SS type B sorting domain-containing protein [Cryomorphaceae bacterium]|nr:T9SS type B sorting domain-containing protein [Cryomorphaceae bacterium]
MKKLIGLLIAILPLFSFAQEMSVAGPDITACVGFLVDSGMTAGDYTANENHTITICAEAPETVINLYFNLCDLGDGDQITIYDGPDNTAPVIGTYTGFTLQAQNVFNSVDNTSGCITLNFTSDGADNGNFTAEISCGYPCEPPVAVVNTDGGSPVLTCPGTELSFDAFQSTVAEGFQIVSYEWNMGNGDVVTTTIPEINYTYAEPGGYKIQLHVTDDTDCENNNLTDYVVMVATDPDFTGTSEDVQICLGQEIDLNGVVNGVIWDGSPSTNLGGLLFIPDDQSTCFESDITFTAYAPGQTLETISDLQDIFINFEHSYMGDLTISVICPNGQSLALHQQGGGGTYLGVPVDDDGQPNEQGVGFDYYWAWDATNGTWVDESISFTTLPSDTYAAAQPWDLLLGCPLNGNWTIEICDSFGSDNGFIFDWTINFNPDLLADPIIFTPTFGAACDSTFWSNDTWVTNTSADCNDLTILPTELGAQEYVYNVTNNHGCSYEETVTVTAVQGPIAAASAPAYFCGNTITLNGTVTNPMAGQQYVYQWDQPTLLNNPSIATPSVSNLTSETVFNVTVFPVGAPECSSTSSITVGIPPSIAIFNPDTLLECSGQLVLLTAPEQSNIGEYTYLWQVYNEETETFDFVSDNLWAEVEEPGLYQFTVSMTEPCQFVESSTHLVELQLCEVGDIPNVISPNDDTKNDKFSIEGLTYFKNNTLQVYNRWGTLVYESLNYDNNWSPREEDVADGTYYFILGINFPTGMHMYSGELTILRK